MAAALAPSETSDMQEVSCVLIPLQNSQLLLPNVSVAEILNWRRIEPVSDAPDWCIGKLGWRGEAITVVSFEKLNEQAASKARQGSCLIVMNRANPGKGPRFYAIVAQGLPRMLQLEAADLGSEERPLGPVEQAIVTLGTEDAVIPDLAFIEKRLASLRSG